MSRLKILKSDILIWLLLLAIGLSTFSCNSNNHSAGQLIHKERAVTGGKAGTQTKGTTGAIPIVTGKHYRVYKANILGDTSNGLGEALEGTAKFTLGVAIVGGIVIGSMYLDYQIWKLQDKMF